MHGTAAGVLQAKPVLLRPLLPVRSIGAGDGECRHPCEALSNDCLELSCPSLHYVGVAKRDREKTAMSEGTGSMRCSHSAATYLSVFSLPYGLSYMLQPSFSVRLFQEYFFPPRSFRSTPVYYHNLVQYYSSMFGQPLRLLLLYRLLSRYHCYPCRCSHCYCCCCCCCFSAPTAAANVPFTLPLVPLLSLPLLLLLLYFRHICSYEAASHDIVASFAGCAGQRCMAGRSVSRSVGQRQLLPPFIHFLVLPDTCIHSRFVCTAHDIILASSQCSLVVLLRSVGLPGSRVS